MDVIIDSAAKFLLVAKEDLKAAMLLHERKLYAQSFFYFQQATEKTNKAYYLHSGVANATQVRKAGHDEFKLHKRALNLAKTNKENALKAAGSLPFIGNMKLIDKNKISSDIESLKQTIDAITLMKENYCANIPTNDIKKFLAVLKGSKPKKLKLINNGDLQLFLTMSTDFINALKAENSKESITFAEIIEKEFLGNREGVTLLLNIIAEAFHYHWYCIVAYICSILTNGHSEKPRYVDIKNPGKIPSKLYTGRNAIVRMQPEFMKYLWESINGLIKLIK